MNDTTPCPLGGVCVYPRGCEAHGHTVCPPNVIPNANKAQIAAMALREQQQEEAE